MERNVALRHVYYDHVLDYIMKEQVKIAPSEEGTVDVFYLVLPTSSCSKEGKTRGTKLRIVLTDALIKTTYRL